LWFDPIIVSGCCRLLKLADAHGICARNRMYQFRYVLNEGIIEHGALMPNPTKV